MDALHTKGARAPRQPAASALRWLLAGGPAIIHAIAIGIGILRIGACLEDFEVVGKTVVVGIMGLIENRDE